MSRAALLLPLLLLSSACRRDMFDQPKYRPLAKSDFFTDGRSARPLPADTIAFDENDEGEAIERGTANGNFVATIPVPVDEALLNRGEERFNIYCSPCHGRIGDGHGMVAKRGFHPAGEPAQRLACATRPPGYIYRRHRERVWRHARVLRPATGA